MTVVTLYGKPDCCLCDEARAAIEAMRDRLEPFELREVDIETDDELHRRFLERIPVVELDGEIVSELVFEPEGLIARLDRVQPVNAVNAKSISDAGGSVNLR